MKKTFHSIFLTCMLVALASCSDDFLERTPTDQVSDQAVFTTTTNARIALNGIHRFMFSRVSPPDTQDSQGQGSIMITMDMMGEDLVMSSTGNGWYNRHYRWIDHRVDNSTLCSFPYRFYYRIIANANLIITNIDKADGLQADRNDIKAQALVYRAFSYYMLVQLYGKRYVAGVQNTQDGVPLLLELTTEAVGRSSVETVYAQINTDLDQAITLFAAATARKTKSNLNINVAYGMKARVALTQGNWATAAQQAALARNGYPLMSRTEYTAGFNDLKNQEWIWGSDQVADQQTYFASFFAYMSHNFNSTNIRTNPKLINKLLYEAIPGTDVRRDNFALNGLTAEELPVAGALSRPYQNRKFKADSPGLSIGDVVYMRAAEMFLIEAEALARQDKFEDAAAALFALNSARDASYTLSTNTGQALIDEILTYRRMELWGEGFRFLDLKRLNASLDRGQGLSNHDATLTNGVFVVPAGDKRWEFLIPLDEINNNKNPDMRQNPL